MTRSEKIQVARLAVQITAGICASAVVSTVTKTFKPVNLTTFGKVVWGLGEWSISSVVAETVMEYTGRTFDSYVENNANEHILRDVILPK